MCCFILLSKNPGALPATTLDTFKAIIVLKIRKNRSKHHVSTGFLLAAEEGFEPSHTESESANYQEKSVAPQRFVEICTSFCAPFVLKINAET